VFAHRGARAAAQEVDDIFGDPDDLLELYERGKAARGASGGARPGAEPEEAPEPLEGEEGEEGAARQAAFAQRQVPPSAAALAQLHSSPVRRRAGTSRRGCARCMSATQPSRAAVKQACMRGLRRAKRNTLASQQHRAPAG